MATKKASTSKPSDLNRLPVAEDYLKELIAQGELAPGQRVTEAEVMAATGASRSKVRQAFQRLAIEGIMTIEEFRGASVKRLSLSEVIQLYQVREVLEGLAARLCAKQGPAKLKESLGRLQTKMDGSEETGDSPLFSVLNNKWHEEIIEGSGNTFVQVSMRRLNVPINRLLTQFPLKPSDIGEANGAHREITRAIIAGAADVAERAMRRHIRSAYKLLCLEQRNRKTLATD